MVLDQDSVANVDMLKKYTELCRDNKKADNIAVYTPQIIDRNYNGRTERYDVIEDIHFAINSGSLIRCKAWNDVDGYDENLFVDMVDYDFSIKLAEHNYKILRLNSIYLEHSIGDITIFNFFEKKIKVYNHNYIRKYDLSYANVYLYNKHRKYIKKDRRFSSLQHIVFRIIKRCIVVIFFESDKKTKLVEIMYGVNDGLRGKNKYLMR